MSRWLSLALVVFTVSCAPVGVEDTGRPLVAVPGELPHPEDGYDTGFGAINADHTDTSDSDLSPTCTDRGGTEWNVNNAGETVADCRATADYAAWLRNQDGDQYDPLGGSNPQPSYDETFCCCDDQAECGGTTPLFPHDFIVPATGAELVDDCDDTDDTINPGATEIWYDTVDQACDGGNDFDQDGDGFDCDGSITAACVGHTGTDCDDTAATGAETYPGAAENESAVACRRDDDTDGYGDINATGNVEAGTDCDDSEITIFPSATELCDGLHNDCTDAGWTSTPPATEVDDDDDTFVECTLDVVIGSWGNPEIPAVAGGGDCDDTSATAADTWPGAATNDSASDCMRDVDGDDWGDLTVSGTIVAGTDCDDGEITVFPNATELCDGLHNDCTDAGWTSTPPATEVDDDDDTFVECTLDVAVANWNNPEIPAVAGGGDCDDTSGTAADTWPGAATNDSTTDCMRDVDGDDWGDLTVSGTIVAGTDCDDSEITVYPSATELCDGLHNDCTDAGWTSTPPATEVDDDDDTFVECTLDVAVANWNNPEIPAVAGGGDCDDTSGTAADTWPGAATNDSATDCMRDVDGDEWGDLTVSGTIVAGTDCDDGEITVFPNATELCDGLHNDCTDAGWTSTPPATEVDDDDDTFVECTLDVAVGSWNNPEIPAVAGGGDCDDTSGTAADTWPGAATNDSATDCMRDVDGDDWGDLTVSGTIVAGTDCDDSEITIYPTATELCDGLHNDCTDAGWTSTPPNTEVDDDDDTFVECTLDVAVANWNNPEIPAVAGGGDCDDTSGTAADTWPGAAGNDSATDCMRDVDGDDWGDLTVSGTIVAGTDCDDSEITIHPTATELCDGLHNDCTDAGWTSTPPATEIDDDDDTFVECTLDVAVGSWNNPEIPAVAGGGDCDDTSGTAADTWPGAAPNDSATDCMRDVDTDDWGDLTVSGTIVAGSDCDDGEVTVYPNATELCDGLHNDCTDGGWTSTPPSDEVDDDDDTFVECTFSPGIDQNNWGFPEATPVLGDEDCADSYGTVFPGQATEACDGYPSDCDDWTNFTTPGARPPDEVDNDDDGYVECTFAAGITAGNWGNSETVPVVGDEDCDDTYATVYPGAFDDCDGFPSDCDDWVGGVAGAPGASELDDDDDGFVDCAFAAGITPANWGNPETVPVIGDDDCDDTDIFTFPGAATNDSATLCMTDVDGDNWGSETPVAGVSVGNDCDDSESTVRPSAAELCDGLHNNCNLWNGTQPNLRSAEIDDDDDQYVDCTLDVPVANWGNPETIPVAGGGDCNDGDVFTFPGAAEDETDPTQCRTDADTDGFGDDTPIAGVVAGTDCDDTETLVYPGAPDQCDGESNDCDDWVGGVPTLGAEEIDGDNDGYVDCTLDVQVGDWGNVEVPAVVGGDDCNDARASIYPGATELCDGYHNNCNDWVGGSPELPDNEIDDDDDRYVECTLVVSVGNWGNPEIPTIIGGRDCDDTSAQTFVGAASIDSSSACMKDEDLDNYGDDNPPGGVVAGSDCDDDTNFTFPGAAQSESTTSCRRDEDNDGYGSDSPPTGVIAGGDCVDDPAGALTITGQTIAGNLIYPGHAETYYNGIDQDCAGDNDFDQDDDNYVPTVWAQYADTLNVGDCDDTILGQLNLNSVRIFGNQILPSATEQYYDGVDQNCDSHSDFDQDFDTFDCELTVNANCPTVANGGVDCLDSGSVTGSDGSVHLAVNVNPNATELFYDDVDRNCDDGSDWDADGDGFDCNGTFDSPLNPSFDLCEGHAGDDCDDTVDLISPDAAEYCNTGAPAQLDDDCDGNINTQDGAYSELDNWIGAPTPATLWYKDFDGDGEGGAEQPLTYLCQFESGFIDGNTDCDDNNPQIFSGATERCNSQDDNCEGTIDEPSLGAAPSGCQLYVIDADRDEFGHDDPDSATQQLCVCPPFFQNVDNRGPENDPLRCNASGTVSGTSVHASYVATAPVWALNSCWTDDLVATDCNDSNADIHPSLPGEIPLETIDGIDNDCDGNIVLMEIDCDNDGAYAMLPIEPPAAGVSTPDEVGLTSCLGATVPSVNCFGELIPLTCSDAGFWRVGAGTLESIGVFSDGQRTGQAGGICDGWDCDDTCADRCEGNEEACDGIDNDCNNADLLLAAADINGIPDSMESALAGLGYVVVEELDQDGDSHIACEGALSGPQRSVTDRACASVDPTERGGDCNDLCGLASPSIDAETCNGFTTADTCADDGIADNDEEDSDQDGHRVCGAWGANETEDVFLLVYADGEIDATDPEVTLVPLLSPRGLAVECDTKLTDAMDAIGATPDLPPGHWWEPALRTCIAADTCRNREVRVATLGGDSQTWWPADCGPYEDVQCGVVKLGVTEDLDREVFTRTLDGCMDDTSYFPEQAITRTVWSGERISQARNLVVEWECYRQDGTFGCGDATEPEGWVSPYEDAVSGDGGFVDNGLSTDILESDDTWWKEMTRYGPEPVVGVSLVGCWGNPARGIDNVDLETTGGDCNTEEAEAHRDNAEGPGDLRGIYEGEIADCGTCLDGIDNNCNGTIDCAEPACAQCFVGMGTGCSRGEDPCAQAGCDSGGSKPGPTGVAMLFALALGASVTRRRRERA